MQTVKYDIGFGVSRGFGASPGYAHVPANKRLYTKGGQLYRDGKPFKLYGTGTYHCSAVPETTGDCDAIVRYLLQMGFNTLRFTLPFHLKWLEANNATYGNWGLMKYQLKYASTVAIDPADTGEGNAFNPTAMDRLCYFLAALKRAGIYCSMVNNTYAEWLIRAGLPQGTLRGQGMLALLPSARAVWYAAMDPFMTWPNPYLDNQRMCDNEALDWQGFNEDYSADVTYRATTSDSWSDGLWRGAADTAAFNARKVSGQVWLGQIMNGINGNEYWRPELNAQAQIIWALGGGAGNIPGNQWPLKTAAGLDNAQFTSTPGGGKDIFLLGIGKQEVALGNEVCDWFRSYNKNIHYVSCDYGYCTPYFGSKFTRPNTSMGHHIYKDSFDSGQGAPYKQSGGVLTTGARSGGTGLTSGSYWGFHYAGADPSNPEVSVRLTEDGDYGEDGRFNYEMIFANGIVSALAGVSLIQQVAIGQQKQQYKAISSEAPFIHNRVRKPGFELAGQAFAPVFINSWIDALPLHTTTLTEQDWLTFARTFGAGSTTGKNCEAFRLQATGAITWAAKRMRLDFGATKVLDAANWPSVPTNAQHLAATVSSPLVLQANADGTLQVGMHPGGWLLNRPGRMAGWVNTVPASATLGFISTGALSETLTNAYLFARSDDDTEFGTSPWKLYAASHCFQLVPVAITFTAALTGATSGTLTAGFGGVTGTYEIEFSDGSLRMCAFTNGSTAASWTGAVTATASATYNSTGFSRIEDGNGAGGNNLVRDLGTFADIWARTPNAIPVTLFTKRDQIVLAQVADGSWLDMGATFNSGTGMLSFTTNPLYPVYSGRPKPSASNFR